MPQVRLTVEGIKSRRKKKVNKMYSDAGCRCLYLKTTTSGTASWVFRYRDRVTSKLHDMGCGTCDEVSLTDVRETVSDLHKLVREGDDPIAARQRKRQERIAEQAKAKTFQQCAEAYYQAKIESTGLTEKHKRRWKSIMRDHVYPKLGPVLIRDIETAHVQSVLQPIWTAKLDTAKRARQNIEQVLGYAKASMLRSGENPARWRDNLNDLLASPRDIRKAKPVQHHKAVPWQEIKRFVGDLRQQGGMAARVLEFLILTAARSGETRYATWDEFDLNANLWIIPATRMKKNDKQHIVPLSDATLKLLNALPRHEKSPYVFWSPRGGTLTDSGASAVLRRMKVDATVHGFRTTFKDWARTSTNYADEVSELALSHVNSDATRAAYTQDELIRLRTLMMRDWSKFIDTKPTGGNQTR